MKMKMLGIGGRSGSGKSTVGDMLKEFDERIELLAFADPLKDFCTEIFDFSFDQVRGKDKERPDLRYKREDGELLTPRYAMQRLGTEWGRHCHPNIWVKYGLRRARESMEQGRFPVFTDVRFPNEAQFIRRAGGEIWGLQRTSNRLTEATARHASEAGDFKADVNIPNHGSLASLRTLIHQLWSSRR